MRADLPVISEVTIEQAIAKSVAEVVQTMIGEDVAVLGRTPTPMHHSRPVGIEGPHAVASVGFVGDANGIVNVHFDGNCALAIASKMLGMTPEDVQASEVMADALGELANMIVGVFKNGLGDLGYCCKLTLPTIIHGNNFFIDHGSKCGSRYVFNFKWRGYSIVTDIIVKED